MTATLLVSSLVPFLLAGMMLVPAADRWLRPLCALAALPALLASSFGGLSPAVRFDGVLLGASVGLDEVGRAFLGLTSTVWLLSGLYAAGALEDPVDARRFWPFYLVTLGGNIGAVIAQDALTFYVFFSVMTVAAYGLVNHARTPRAVAAGRFFISFALFGEMLVFSGLVLAAASSSDVSFLSLREGIARSGTLSWAVGLVFVGFGVKAGLVPLHAWLPRAYFAAPVAAVAVLSGAMSKAGVLGWLRHLPFGAPATEALSMALLSLGVLTAFYGAIVGWVQTRARTALAFSSLSQMGYVGIIVATGMAPGADAAATATAAVAFSVHHAITKLALFFAVDLLESASSRGRLRWIVLASSVYCGASLVGLPLTTGTLAKSQLKGLPGAPWADVATVTLTLGGAATALLVVRFLVLAWRQEPGALWRGPSSWIAWALAVFLCAIGGVFLPMALEQVGFVLGPMDWLASIKSSAIVLGVAGVSGWVVRAVLFRDAALTPRPLEGLIGTTRKTFGRDIPQWIAAQADAFGHATQRSIESMRITDRAAQIVARARALQMSWATGVILFLSTWLALWLLLTGGVS